MTGQHISGSRARKLAAKPGTVIVDVRSPVAFRDGSVPNAINMSLRHLAVLTRHPRTSDFIFVGDPKDPDTLRAATSYMTQLGYQKVFSLGSADDWNK